MSCLYGFKWPCIDDSIHVYYITPSPSSILTTNMTAVLKTKQT